jgi:hypothetical protein
MSIQQKFLNCGRANPGAGGAPTTLYTAPALTTSLLQNLHICNTSTTVDDKVRVFVVPSGGSGDNTNAIIYDMTIPVGNPFEADIMLALGAADFVAVYSLNGTSTFTLSGIEVTGSSNQTFKSFGRSNPNAAANTTLYTAPASTTSLLQCLVACNTSAADDKIRVFLVPSAGAAGVSNAIIFDLVVQFGNPFAMNTIPTLNAGDFLVVYSLNGTTTFTASGLELS